MSPTQTDNETPVTEGRNGMQDRSPSKVSVGRTVVISKDSRTIIADKEKKHPESEASTNRRNSKTSDNLQLPDLQAPVSFEDSRRSRSPKIAKRSSLTSDGRSWRQSPQSTERNQKPSNSRSPLQRRQYPDSHGWRGRQEESRGCEERKRVEDGRRQSRSPRRERVPVSRPHSAHHSDQRRPRSPIEAVSSSRLHELLEIEKEMKRRKLGEGDAKQN